MENTISKEFITNELKDYFNEENTQNKLNLERTDLSLFMNDLFNNTEINIPYLEVEDLRTGEDGSIFFTYYSEKIGKGILLDYKGLYYDMKYSIEELTELIYKNIEKMMELENKLPKLK